MTVAQSNSSIGLNDRQLLKSPGAAMGRVREEVCERVDRDEVVASLQFFALVFVLFVLPDEELDVLFGLNPQRVWLIVVFIAGLSFLGYLLARAIDPRTAIVVTGVVGGGVSPGLTIVSFVEQTKRDDEFERTYAWAAAIAVTMLFPRNLVVFGIVSPSLAYSLVLPFGAMAGVSVAVTGVVWSRIRTRDPPTSELDISFQIRPALVFGAGIAVILLAIDTFEVSLPSDATRVGIVLGTVSEMTVYVGITWMARATKMARVIALILLGSASVGTVLVLLI